MRELKFRAWVTEKETYDDTEPRKPFMTDSFGFCDFDGEYFKPSHISLFACEFKIMQYTGIKDMNGVEVFQGDILNLYNVFKTPMRMGVVKFDIGRSQNVIYYKDSNCGFDINAFEHIEVVGNIFENPDMMNEAHTN